MRRSALWEDPHSSSEEKHCRKRREPGSFYFIFNVSEYPSSTMRCAIFISIKVVLKKRTKLCP